MSTLKSLKAAMCTKQEKCTKCPARRKRPTLQVKNKVDAEFVRADLKLHLIMFNKAFMLQI